MQIQKISGLSLFGSTDFYQAVVLKKKIGFADRNHLLRRVISRIVSRGFYDVEDTTIRLSPIGLKMKVALSLSI